MPKTVRKSSENNILSYSSDYDQNTRRDSKWWRDLSDKSTRGSITANIRNLGNNEKVVLSDGSYTYGKVNSQWWQNLSEDESLILQRKIVYTNTTNSVIEEDENNAHESHNNDENVGRQTLFTDLRSRNHRFSKAFCLEPEQTQITQDETEVPINSEINNKEITSAENAPRKGELLKTKIKRKTVQLFSRKPYSQRFSAAFHTSEEEKVQNDHQDESNKLSQLGNEGNEQISEIIVPATQENFKSQNSVVEDNIEVNETLATNLETTVKYGNDKDKKPNFSEAFTKSKVNETSNSTNDQPAKAEKNSVSHKSGIDETVDMNLNQSVQLRKKLFEKKEPQSRKFSEAFSKTKQFEVDESINESIENIPGNQSEPVEPQLKSVRISKQIDVNEIIQTKQDLFGGNVKQSRKFSEAFTETRSVEITAKAQEFLNEQVERESDNSTSSGRKSLIISKQNETNQLEISKSIQKKPNLFKDKIKEGRKFSEAFSETRIFEKTVQDELPNESKKDKTNQLEISESIQTKQNLFEDKIKTSRKFSEAFAKTKQFEVDESINKNIENIPGNQSEPVEPQLKSVRISKQIDVNEIIQTKQDLFGGKVKQSRKFSEAFTETRSVEITAKTQEFLNEQVERESDNSTSSGRKSLRLSKQNETKQLEISKSIQTKPNLFKDKVKEGRKFSEAFSETRIFEKTVQDELPNESKKDETNQLEISESIQTKQNLFKDKIKKGRKFSEAFANSRILDGSSDREVERNIPVATSGTRKSVKFLENNENQDMSANKSSEGNTIEKPNESSSLSTLPSINDTLDTGKILLFKPKARKSLFSVGNTPTRMKKIDENAAVESDPTPEATPSEATDHNVYSDSVTSRFFETSLISSTKFNINPNETRRNSVEESFRLKKQISEENGNQSKSNSRNKRSLRSSGKSSAEVSLAKKQIEEQHEIANKDKSESGNRIENIECSETKSHDETQIDEQEAQLNRAKSLNKRSLSSKTVQRKSSTLTEYRKSSNEKSPQQKKQIDCPEEAQEALINKDKSLNKRSLSSKTAPRKSSTLTEYRKHSNEKSPQQKNQNDGDEEVQQINNDKSRRKKSLRSLNTIPQESSIDTESNQSLNEKSPQQKKQIDNTEEKTKQINKNLSSSKRLPSSSNSLSQEMSAHTGNRESSDDKRITNDAYIEVKNDTKIKVASKIPVLRQTSKSVNELQIIQNRSVTGAETNETYNKSKRKTTGYEEADSNTEEKSKTSTKSRRNTSKLSTVHLNDVDIQTKTTEVIFNIISTERADTDKNDTDRSKIQTNARKSNLKYSTNLNEKTNGDRQSNINKSKNEPSKKSLRFTENHGDGNLDENEDNMFQDYNSRSSNRVLVQPVQRNFSSEGNESSKQSKTDKTTINNEVLRKRKELLLQAIKEINPPSSRIIQNQIPSKKITDFFSRLNMNELQRTQNKVTKSKPKPVSNAFLIDGKVYRPKKLFSGQRWCNKRCYKFLQNKMQDKYGETTILESENLMRSLADSVRIITKSNKYCAREVKCIKKELARNNIITTTFDFYRFIEDYLPSEFRERVIPRTRANHADTFAPNNREELFKPILF